MNKYSHIGCELGIHERIKSECLGIVEELVVMCTGTLTCQVEPS